MADEPKRRYSLLAPMRRTSMAQEGHGVEAGADLDEEMEKVFAMADEERFDVAKLAVSPDSTGSKRSFGEKDYSLHRKKSYPHVHTPLKSIHSRSMRRQVTSPRGSESDSTDIPTPGEISVDDVRTLSISETDTVQDGPTLSTYTVDSSPRMDINLDDEDDKEELILSIDSEPQVSERAASHSNDPEFGSSLDRRVQFEIDIAEKPEDGLVEDEEGEEEERKDSLVDDAASKEDRKAKRKHGRHHHHRSFRKYSLPEDPQWRKRSGSEFGLPHTRRISIQPEEALTMQQHDIDDLTSHRFDDARGVRRYKLQAKSPPSSLVHISRKEQRELPLVLPIVTLKKMFDHSPHEVFVQLDELHGIGEEREWKETARWIKYEEDVEEGADRWGRPHVASLSFHSLLNLRRCLETGVVLLDLEEKDLTGVAHRVVEQMVVDELIEADDKPTVMRALLLRHRHVNGHERFRFGMKRTFSSYTSLQNLNEDKKPKIVPSNASIEMSIAKSANNHSKHSDSEKGDHTVEIKEETYTSSSEDLKKAQNENILKRIPFGAEATTVLVGAVDFLEQPTIAFVRLAEGILMPSITEVSIPVRFLFILLGPTTANLDYHEIGRSISTLMSNTQFHKIAYKADERKELLSAINEFLDDSIVVPPGDWERKALLPFEDLKAKSEMIRRRKSTRTQVDSEVQKALIAGDSDKPPFDDPLRRTRRPFGGLINDVKRRLPYYASDIKDGLNLQCLAATIFIYFAAVSAAITFGGIMGQATRNCLSFNNTSFQKIFDTINFVNLLQY